MRVEGEIMGTMRTSLEVIAPTVDEAVARGAAELGRPESELEVEVLDEGGKGVLGLGARQARVRLSVRTAGEPRQPQSRAALDISEDDSQALQVAVDTVSELLTRMGFVAKVTAHWDEQSDPDQIRPLHVDIHGDDLSPLIGRKGETLSALQYISRLIVSKELDAPVAVAIDIEGYRARREQQLRQLARRMAQQAEERGRTLTLEPMPANERRIIHLELRDHPSVYTESTGEGSARKVSIIPRTPDAH
jgi:spoIIIJ-associated protein